MKGLGFVDRTSAANAEPRSVGVVIVAYNPAPVLETVISAISDEQPTGIVVVDNSPQGSDHLERAARAHPGVTVVARPENIGFCAGNNLGVRMLPPTDFVLFLNPDAVVPPGFLDSAVEVLEAHPSAGALGPKLVGLDGDSLEPTGRIDSTGIFTTWYGRVFDRGQGTPDDGRYDGPAEPVPALCAAAMLCRRDALGDVTRNGQIFDEAFFMYKEDVDLSYRLRREGWTLLYASELAVGHVRGVRNVRADRATRRQLRLRSLRNDWRIWRKGDLPAKIRLPMFAYLVAKTARLRLFPWRTP